MASIKLENVTIDFAVYNNRGRSFKNRVLSSVVGGSVSSVNGMTTVRALESVSLDICAGDRYALIGHNGAGKSTLLRVLAGIYKPTGGRIQINGEVMPMFDPNLGISPESTGWENIQTRGILLGMSDAEIESMSQEVAEMSGLGDFLDMPVRTYSSGMRMRLAFCVSTSAKPEILLLDETVVVGDVGFLDMANKKLDHLIADSNVLVLASHSRQILRRLCNKGIYLNKGKAVVYECLDSLFEYYDKENAAAKKKK